MALIKRYHIGKVYKKSQSSSEQRKNVLENLEGSFDIVQMPSSSSGSGSGKGNSGDEFIYEAEAIKVCDQVAQGWQREIGKYWIKVSSTEIIDGIMDEGMVKLQDRLQVLKLLSNFENKNWKEL